MLKLSTGGGGGEESNTVDLLESDPVDLLSQSRPDKKLKPKREAKPPEKKFPSHKESSEQSCYRCLGNHDHKGCPFKGEKCYHCNKTGHLKGPVKPRKGRHRVPDPQLIIWTVMMEIVMTT